VAHGAALRLDPAAPATLGESLRRAAQEHGDHGVVYVSPDGVEDHQSYPKLLEQAERVLAGLRQLGLQPGDKVLFQFDRNRDFLSAFWGCVLGGFIPAPLAVAPTYAGRTVVS
jgi:acyl-CoA synthetase (AMP-forming)/AMP-acid ligase II